MTTPRSASGRTALAAGRPTPTLALLALGFAFTAAHGQMIDLNGNGMSDVWEQVYNAGSLNPAGDDDGDGFSNRAESIAGSDPFDPKSFPQITLFSNSAPNFTVTTPAQLGKQYQLQSTTALDATNWTVEATLVCRTGTNVSLAATNGPAAKFFRLAVADIDSDGDGLNDWEEYKLGLDPFNPYSNGTLDGSGKPLTDYQYAAGRLPLQNIFTIIATDPTANEPAPGQAPFHSGLLTLTRSGFPLNSVTVALALGGPGPGFATEGLDHAVLPRSLTFPAGVSSQTITVTPLANTNLAAQVISMLTLLPGAGYRLAAATSASVVIYPSATPNGSGLTGQYFTNSSPIYTNQANFNPANLVLQRVDPTVDFIWGTNTLPIPNSGGHYSVRWTGQVQPQYSETYYFVANTDDGVRLWVNDQLIIDAWTNKGASDVIGTSALQAGVRYDISMEYYQNTGAAVAHLSWYSPSQPKQIIPAARLYPASTPPAPAAVTSPLSAVAFVGQPFSYTVTGANLPTSYTASGLPPGLSFNPASGLISGVPSLAGNFQVTLTTANSAGLGASIVLIQVLNTGSSVVQEIWAGVPGINVSDIPVNTPATTTQILGALHGSNGYGSNYAERVRGFFTAPVTGNYYFWIAASDAAELWLSNDSEPVNKVRRAWVLPVNNPAPPPYLGTAPRQWNLQPNQRSGWLSLAAGQAYYLEILHKVGVETNDNWAVGWLQDPTGTNTTPAGTVPGYVLSRYYPLPLVVAPGALYTANLLAQQGSASTGVGTATLRVSAAGSQASLRFSDSGLSSPITGRHIHNDAYVNPAGTLIPSGIMFDIDATPPQPDGSYIWNIGPVGALTAADVLEIIREGKAYLNIHTVKYPAGEINGHFTLVDGSQTFTPPPPPPVWTDDSANTNAAARFLIQATFGPSPADIAAVQTMGYANWIAWQFSLPATHHLPVVFANVNPDPTRPFPSSLMFNTWWQQSVSAPDQLRQRVAFALSEVMVVSENGVLANNYANCLSSYYDLLLDNAFGNFRALLEAVTLHPAMGIYLNMLGNDAGSIVTGVHANENYAREIQQLFSIGLNRLWPDGSLVMNSQSALVPTYGQNEIMGFASVFTGWNYYQALQGNGRLPVKWPPGPDYVDPMVLVPAHHELGAKQVLDSVVLPPAQGSQANPASINFDNYCAHDLEAALDSIFYNQNVGPFICRQLIQRLVTSNPSRGYLYRVVQAFNDNGQGVRGDLTAVIKAILLDYEARSSALVSVATYGKQREPLCRVTAAARAFPGPPPTGGTYSQNGSPAITVTTTNAHRLNTGDTVLLTFTDTSGQVIPPAQGYGVTVATPTVFTCTAAGILTGTYAQTNNTITLAISGHGVTTNFLVYLGFTSGSAGLASNGVYQVLTAPDSSHFTVAAPDSATRLGACFLPKLTGGGYTNQNRTNVTVDTALMHGLSPGDSVFLAFNNAGSPLSGPYQLVTVPDPVHFMVIVGATNNQTRDNLTVYPLVPPVLTRSGTVAVQWNTWNMGYSDTGSTASLSQSPLRSPTVFNFFFPDYQFPGTLAAAGLTTPEFQLTYDTSVALQMNFLEGGVLNNGGNTNGLTSFTGGNGAIVLDISPWMTSNYTSAAGVPGLVDALNTLLLAGQLSPGAKTSIVNYVTNTANFSYGSPPSATQMRDRVRAVVHQLINSPDFTIQK